MSLLLLNEDALPQSSPANNDVPGGDLRAPNPTNDTMTLF